MFDTALDLSLSTRVPASHPEAYTFGPGEESSHDDLYVTACLNSIPVESGTISTFTPELGIFSSPPECHPKNSRVIEEPSASRRS